MNIPKVTYFNINIKEYIDVIVKGQGVFVFSTNSNDMSHFTLYNIDKTDGISINITKEQVLVNRIGILSPYVDNNNSKGLSQLKGSYYWFSFDAQNQQFHFGLGEARIETAIYSHKLVFDAERDDLRKDHKKFLESLVIIHINESIIPIRLLRDPITKSIPMLVRDNLSMIDIASLRYMPKANLSLTSQKLYDCIAGDNFELDTDDFPDFSKAIENSIINPNGWCYKKLLAKANEFNKDKPNLNETSDFFLTEKKDDITLDKKPSVFLSNETYLRITLGQNNGESPGIPYVMEIWPSGHYSPIHNHGGSEAIIRVLHGSINVSLYPFLCNEEIKFSEANFSKGDITWISPTLNQTHKLRNIDNNVCITIQCYMYDNDDIIHYDYFDYLDIDNNILHYEPDSDMEFIDFKNSMKQEWEQNNPKKLFCCI